MSYLVLARKYRPRTFADMVGQETVTRTLRGAIAENRVGHAYLFCGPRGTGKTTTARILAKALNCESGPTADPCGTCERCRAADDGSEVDIVEIDAASNTGVDDVRLLRDQVAYAPMRARYKVYIIDEVHMLSRGAFNAFLKTLEEPPAHVKFLFATTDPQKVPETILSRCQVLKLAPIPEAVIAARLDHVFGIENVRAEDGVTREIARRARGGMRDALSLSDQLLSLVGSEPKVADVARLSEGGAFEELDRLVGAVVERDRRRVLECLPRNEGGEVELLASLLEHVRAMLLATLSGPDLPLLAETKERHATLRRRGEALGADRLQSWLEELLVARERVRVLPAHARAILEVTLLDLCREETTAPIAQLLARLAALEQRVASGLPPRPATPPGLASTPNAARPAGAGAGVAPATPSGSSSPSSLGAPAAPSASPSSPSSPASPASPASAAGAPPARASFASPSAPAFPSSTASTSLPPRASPPAAPSTTSAPNVGLGAASSGTPGAPRASAGVVRASAPVDDEPSAEDLAPARDDATLVPRARGGAPSADTHLAADRPRPMVSGTGDAWARFLETLATSSSSLADTLRLRGKLVDLTPARALVQLANLREAERALVLEARNQRAATVAFQKATGSSAQVVFEDQSATRAQKDPFTARVAEMFGGQVEDGG